MVGLSDVGAVSPAAASSGDRGGRARGTIRAVRRRAAFRRAGGDRRCPRVVVSDAVVSASRPRAGAERLASVRETAISQRQRSCRLAAGGASAVSQPGCGPPAAARSATRLWRALPRNAHGLRRLNAAVRDGGFRSARRDFGDGRADVLLSCPGRFGRHPPTRRSRRDTAGHRINRKAARCRKSARRRG